MRRRTSLSDAEKISSGEPQSLDESRALEAADVSMELGLAMADAIIFATAARHRAKITTGDADFDGLPAATVIR